MKIKFLLTFFLITTISFSQSAKEERFKMDVAALVEEMEIMYRNGKLLEDYSFYISILQRQSDNIKRLSDSLGIEETANGQPINDSLTNYIYKKYIHPREAEHAKRMIAIVEKYGFPDQKRIRKYYDKEFRDSSFTPLLLLHRAPEKYWKKIKKLMKKELKAGRISQCDYGFLLFHISFVVTFDYLLDNDCVTEVKDGVPILQSTGK